MTGTFCDSACSRGTMRDERTWRRALWLALGVNAGMFLVEIAAGVAAESQALKADALDFFGDAANYAISLAVAGAVLAVRAKAALLKGITLVGFGLWVIGSAVWAALGGTQPQATTMGAIGVLALVANVAVAAMLYRFRDGDSNRRSVWICSRNDAIGNVAVVGAAAGVFGTGSAWPDLIVAGVLAGLAVVGGVQIVRQASREIREERAADSRLSDGRSDGAQSLGRSATR